MGQEKTAAAAKVQVRPASPADASLIYGFAGSMRFVDIAAFATANPGPGLIFGLVFLICGLAFKVSAAPFHMWTPDVYEGAPTPVVALFATAPKVAAMVLIARALEAGFGDAHAQWSQVLIAISLISFVVGAFGGLVQKDIQRLLAYSSIANIGYALLGIAAGTAEGLQAMLMFMTLYVIDQLGFFAILLSLSKSGRPIRRIADLAGLKKDRPLTAVALTILSLSVLGMPPFSGFWGKYYVFGAAANAQPLEISGSPVIGERGKQLNIAVLALDKHFGNSRSSAKVSVDLERRMRAKQVGVSSRAVSGVGGGIDGNGRLQQAFQQFVGAVSIV